MMSSFMHAINAYMPRIVQGPTVQWDELVEFIARSTGLNESGVLQVLTELQDAVLYHNRRGRAVMLDGLGVYSPSSKLDGTLKINHRMDNFLKKRFNMPGLFKGQIANAENIGKLLDDLVAKWNEENPDDPIT
jgi:hypothetical protein